MIKNGEKIDRFLASELQQKRAPQDNAGMTALGALYREFISKRKAKDADIILTHMELYNDEVISGERYLFKGTGMERYNERYNANNRRILSGPKSGLDILNDNLPPLKNGQVIVQTVNRTPLFGLREDKDGFQKIFEEAVSLGAGTSPLTDLFAKLAAVGKELQLKQYFEFNPSAILENGDVVIYYTSPDNKRGYGVTYAFRGDELLYATGLESNGKSTELGPNYMKHAEKYKKDFFGAIESLIQGEIEGYAKGEIAKEIYKHLISR